jgi:hypothetical protein
MQDVWHLTVRQGSCDRGMVDAVLHIVPRLTFAKPYRRSRYVDVTLLP